jgi:hypothetical protein
MQCPHSIAFQEAGDESNIPRCGDTFRDGRFAAVDGLAKRDRSCGGGGHGQDRHGHSRAAPESAPRGRQEPLTPGGFSTCPCVTMRPRKGGAGMVPAKVNTSGSPLARWSAKRWMRILAAGVCFLQLASTPSAAEPELVKLAVSEGKDIRFAHLTNRDGLSPGQIRDILQDNQGFVWFNTSGYLNRYDGYQFRSYTRDPAHPNYPTGGFLSLPSRIGPGLSG